MCDATDPSLTHQGEHADPRSADIDTHGKTALPMCKR